MGWNEDGTEFETEVWPYREANNYTKEDRGRPRVIVIHSAETGEDKDTAVALMNYAATTSRNASWHVSVDGSKEDDGSPPITQSVYDSYVAWAAPGANHDGLQLEQAGRARQSRDEWLDEYGKRLIDRTGDVVAQWCLKYDLPLVKLSNSELRAGKQGIVGHVQVSEVYDRSDHWDPGPGYPYDVLMERAKAHYKRWQSKAPGYQPEDDEPDFRVAVVVSDEVSAGMGRVYASFNTLKFLRHPHEGVTVGTAVLIGGSPDWRDEARDDYDDVHILAGANRGETGAKVAEELKAGYRSADLEY